jgi:hypothetical protein
MNIKKILIIILCLNTFSSFGQDTLELHNFNIQGNIKCKLLYNQYFDSLYVSDTLISPWNFELRRNVNHNPDEVFFAFKCNDCDMEDTYDLVYLSENSVRIKREYFNDDFDCCEVKSLLVSSTRKVYQMVKSINWTLSTNLIEYGCQDTHYSNLKIENNDGIVKFNNLNNITVYELNYYRNRSSLIIISTRRCRNQLIIYEVTS